MTNQVLHVTKGFTLIEAVLYVGLTTLLLTGVIAASYPIFTSAQKGTDSVIREGEIAFAVQKIIAELNKSTALSIPQPHILGITQAGGPITVTYGGGGILINRGAGMVPLTTTWTNVTNLVFARTGSTLTINISANGVALPTITRYVHY